MPRNCKPWTDAEIALLGTETDSAIAKRIGRSVGAVQVTRYNRGIPSHLGRFHSRAWGTIEAVLFEQYDDAKIAKMTRRPLATVAAKRKELGR